MNNIAIKLTNISKRYTIHHEKPTLSERLINGKNEEFWALKNFNLTINKGEIIGMIGPNGSGKTTLLKIISGITNPTSGILKTNGKLVSLIDIQAGFHADLTGEQNIYINGMLLGMSKSEIKSKIGKIVKFADIGKFIDAPLFTYSGGMCLRLGFSVAVNSDPDILIFDEGISAGDQDFQLKIKSKLHSFYLQHKTIIFVTQWIAFLKKNCNKVIIMENGKIKKIGNTSILNSYK
ncbi:MAG: hypothetical protein UT84_C0031G0006 [Candidatus Curtissbacteria bacterium GW2011_GWA1_40_16]|uniref:ABC transporter domain-containing protein n=1 Tax=Candidatus Curtissbacteria bacterium GW2011_GWA1_40_16 TaxID=1618405 RepID=A0A0G0RHM9_9BACT|nr:MAG: hypothetical protein UT84_C0031G0006 [Candidatus Curtissbacteria bacterium GW2011_GWA1_40_16]